MVLEEIGVFGFVLFLMWSVALIGSAVRRGLVSTAIVVTVLLVNLGEANLFSPGGMGLFLLIVISMAVTAPPPSPPMRAASLSRS